MGSAASRADHVLLTSDNPRGEAAADIADQIRDGVEPGVDVRIQLDRRAAIRRAVHDAGERDVIVIAGKGPEVEQIVGRRVLPFHDEAEARAALRARGAESIEVVPGRKKG
jgi:UDP-N-acetylmuramoyl-L-alanyl-D-glutamate--2,6-diaminopimelate ligase